MTSFPRPDQLSDFVRHRVTRVLGGRAPWAIAARGALTAVGRERGRAFARYSEALDALERGHQPPWEEVAANVIEILALADRALSRGLHRSSVWWVDLAVRLAFHRSVHYGRLNSPLMVRTEEFLAPFKDSAAARHILLSPDLPSKARPDTARRETREAPVRPLRVLILCHSSWTFIRRVEADLKKHTEIEFRTADVSKLPLPERPSHGLVVRLRGAWARDRSLHPVPAELEGLMEWADTVFVDWGTFPFAWLSFLDLSAFNVRLVARIHRFEVLTPYPFLARGNAYDSIGFVSPPLRSFVSAVSPRIRQVNERPTFHNIHDLEGFAPASPKDCYRLVQIGWATPTKDVGFSLDVLRRLREEDERYVLTLVGPTLETTTSPRTLQWASEIEAQIQDIGSGVEILGFRSDIPHILGKAGFIISSSVSEGTHESVAEGAASGCIPVVRDWPEIAPWGGAGMVYPKSWIISNAEDAVERIRAFQAPDDFALESSAVREWVLGSRDPAAIRQDYVNFLTGPCDET